MNLIRYRRNLIIIIGMILMNIVMQIYVGYKGMDAVTIGSYFSANMIWIDTMRRFCEPLVKIVDEMIKNN